MNMIRKTLPTVVLLLVATSLWAQTTLREGMAALEQRYGVHFVYDAALPLEKKAGKADGATLEQALELARVSAAVSHNHPEGIKGAESVAAAIPITSVSIP